MANIEVLAQPDMRGKEFQLAGGTTTFALKTRFGQAAFHAANGRDLIRAGFDLLGNRVKERGSLFTAGIAVFHKGLFRRANRPVDIILRAARDIKAVAEAWRRPKRIASGNPRAGYQVLAVWGEIRGIAHVRSFRRGRLKSCEWVLR